MTLYFLKSNKQRSLLFLPIKENSLREEGLLSRLAFSFLEKFKKNIKSDEYIKVTFVDEWLTIQLDDFEEDLIDINIPNSGNISFMIEEIGDDLNEVLQNENF